MTDESRIHSAWRSRLAIVAAVALIGGLARLSWSGPTPTGTAPIPNTDAGAGSGAGADGPTPDAGPDAVAVADAAPGSDSVAAKSACNIDVDEAAYKDAHRQLAPLGVPNSANLQHTTTAGMRLLIAIGPDGHPLGTVPTIREDSEIYLVVYHPSDSKVYEINVTGCEKVPVRYLGPAGEVPKGTEPTVAHADVADIHPLGRCSASSSVTVTVSVPDQPTCSQRSPSFIITTAKVFTITAALGGIVWFGDHKVSGIDDGVGGATGHAFERTEASKPDVRLVALWYPLGYSKEEPLWGALRHKLALGTAIDVTAPLSSVNLLAGLEFAPGVAAVAGVEFCRTDKVLARNIHNGDTFTDPASSLPTEDDFGCGSGHTRGFVGLAITGELISALTAR